MKGDTPGRDANAIMMPARCRGSLEMKGGTRWR